MAMLTRVRRPDPPHALPPPDPRQAAGQWRVYPSRTLEARRYRADICGLVVLSTGNQFNLAWPLQQLDAKPSPQRAHQ